MFDEDDSMDVDEQPAISSLTAIDLYNIHTQVDLGLNYKSPYSPVSENLNVNSTAQSMPFIDHRGELLVQHTSNDAQGNIACNSQDQDQKTKFELQAIIGNQNTDKIEQAEPNKSYSIVLDTNYLISRLNFIKNIVEAISEKQLGSIVEIVVPWVVFGELDNLNKGSSAKKSSAEGRSKGGVQKKANAVIAYLETVIDMPGSENGIRGQKVDERLLNSTEASWAVEDDLILDCCRYLTTVENHIAILLTLDKNLSIKAKVHGIHVIGQWGGDAVSMLNCVQKYISCNKDQNRNQTQNPNTSPNIQNNKSSAKIPVLNKTPDTAYSSQQCEMAEPVELYRSSLPRKKNKTTPPKAQTSNTHKPSKAPVKQNLMAKNNPDLIAPLETYENTTQKTKSVNNKAKNKKRKCNYYDIELVDLSTDSDSAVMGKSRVDCLEKTPKTYADLMAERKILPVKSKVNKNANNASNGSKTNSKMKASTNTKGEGGVLSPQPNFEIKSSSQNKGQVGPVKKNVNPALAVTPAPGTGAGSVSGKSKAGLSDVNDSDDNLQLLYPSSENGSKNLNCDTESSTPVLAPTPTPVPRNSISQLGALIPGKTFADIMHEINTLQNQPKRARHE